MADLSDDIERYRKNLMTDAERHALEKKALSDPFLADALEGAESIAPQEFKADVAGLNKRLKGSNSGYGFVLRIAAGIAVVATAGWLFWTSQSTEPGADQLAVTKADSTAAGAGATGDTTQQLLTLATPSKSTEDKQEPRTKKPEVKTPPATSPVAGPVASQPAQTTTEAVAQDLKEEVAEEDVSAKDDRKVAATPSSTLKNRAEESTSNVVTGTVTEAESGVALPGAVIRDLNSRRETRAAEDGNYALQGVADSARLQYSYPGLQTIEKVATNQAPVNVALRDDARQRSEIVVFPLAQTTSRAKRSIASGEKASSTTSMELAMPSVGIESYQRYLEQNERIPESARRANLHGKVTVSFTVDVNGALKDFAILKSVDAACDEELIRLIKQGPAWTPSKEAGKPVPSTVWVKLDF